MAQIWNPRTQQAYDMRIKMCHVHLYLPAYRHACLPACLPIPTYDIRKPRQLWVSCGGTVLLTLIVITFGAIIMNIPTTMTT